MPKVLTDLDVTQKVTIPTSGTPGGIILGGDTNLYRDSVDVLRTDDTFQASTIKSDNYLYLPSTFTNPGVGGAGPGVFASQAGYILLNRGLTTTILLSTIPGDAQYRFTIRGDGRLTWTDGVTSGASAYLEYDSVNDRITTPDSFQAASITSPAITTGARTQAVVTTDDPRLLDEEGGTVINGTGVPGFTTRFLDDFSADNLDRDYDQGAGGRTFLTVSSGVLNVTTSAARILLAKSQVAVGSPYRLPRLTSKVNYGSVAGGSSALQLILRYIDGSNYIYVGMVGNLTLRIVKFDLGAATTLRTVTIAPAPALSTDYWQRSWIDSAGLITAEWWATDPILGGAATFTTTYQLAGADLTKFGPSAGAMPVGIRTAQTAGNLETMDDFRIESYIGQEKDLYRDVSTNLEYGPRANEVWGVAKGVSPVPALSWVAPTFTSPWRYKGLLAANRVMYAISAQKIVHLIGIAENTATFTFAGSNNTICTLPPPYGGVPRYLWIPYTDASAGANMHLRIVVQASGAAVIDSATGSTPPTGVANGSVFFDGASYPAA